MNAPSTVLGSLRPDLGGALEEYDLLANELGYIGLRVFPVIESARQAGTFPRIPLKEMVKTIDDKRTSRGTYNRADYTFTDEPFATSEHGLEEAIDERDRAIYSELFDQELLATRRTRATVLRNSEIRCADALFNAVTWTPTEVGTEWSTVATADPVANVDAAKARMFAATGMYPNALVINRAVWMNLRKCVAITDKIKYVESTLQGDVTTAQVAAALDLEQIIIAGGATNSSNPAQAASMAHIWSSEYAAVIRTSSDMDISRPCVGRTIHWSADGSQIGGAIESYDSNETRGRVVRVRMETQEKVIYTAMCELLSNITA